jgi:hypothetical protein
MFEVVMAIALFDVVEVGKDVNLNASQTKVLERLQKQPATKDLIVVRFNEESFKKLIENEAIEVTIPVKGGKLSMKDGSVKQSKDKQVPGYVSIWQQQTDKRDTPPLSYLRFNDKEFKVGCIFTEKAVYQIDTLGNGLCAIYIVDQTKLIEK